MNTAVEKTDVVIDGNCWIQPEDGNDKTSDDPDILTVMESSGMGHINLDLDVTTKWTTFSAPTL